MADDIDTVPEARLRLAYELDEYVDDLANAPPIKHAIDALIASVRAEAALTRFTDDDLRDLLELMRFVHYDKHTLLKALTFLREQAKG